MAELQYNNDINLNGNELKEAVVHLLKESPNLAKLGQMYFDTNQEKLFIKGKNGWVDTSGGTIDLSTYAKKSQLFSGDYNDLTNKPNLSQYAKSSQLFSGAYSDLTGKPNLSVYTKTTDLGNIATVTVPTTDPATPGVIWLDGTTLKVSQ